MVWTVACSLSSTCELSGIVTGFGLFFGAIEVAGGGGGVDFVLPELGGGVGEGCGVGDGVGDGGGGEVVPGIV